MENNKAIKVDNGIIVIDKGNGNKVKVEGDKVTVIFKGREIYDISLVEVISDWADKAIEMAEVDEMVTLEMIECKECEQKAKDMEEFEKYELEKMLEEEEEERRRIEYDAEKHDFLVAYSKGWKSW